MFVKIPEPGKEDDFPYVRIDGPDCWGLDHTLAYIILPALKILRENKHGVPSQFVPETHSAQMNFEFIEDDVMNDISLKVGERKWNECIDAMIWSFEEIVSGRFHGGSHGLRLMRRSHAEYHAYNERVMQGFRLFGEHYLSLWD